MVRKILFIIFAAFFFFLFLQNAYADNNCSISWQSPNPLTVNDTRVSLNIQVSNTLAQPNDRAHINLTGPTGSHFYTGDWVWSNPDNLTIDSTGNLQIRDMGSDGSHFTVRNVDKYVPGTYTLEVYSGWGNGGTKICSTSFPVLSVSNNNAYCNTSVTVNGDTSDTLRDPAHNIVFKANNFSGNYDHSCVNVKFFDGINNTTTGQVDQGNEITEQHMTPSDLSSKGFTLTQKAVGSYLVVVKSKCDSPITAPDFDVCSAAIKIHEVNSIPPGGSLPPTNCIPDTETGCGPKPCCNTSATCIGNQTNGQVTNGVCISSLTGAVGGGGGIYDYQSSKAIPTPVCSQISGTEYQCHTAIGDINTSAGGFVKSILSVILSIAGSIAVLLIIISGYRLMLSQGNPEQIKSAREQLTAAIVGLLFIVFSLVILQVIGVNILGLPGFK